MRDFPLALCALNLALAAHGSEANAADVAPLSLKTAGAVAGMTLHVADKDSYSVRLDYFYPPNDPVARQQLWAGAGGVRPDATGHTSEQGAPFNVFLRIYDIDAAVVIQDRRIDHPTLSSWGSGVLHAELSEVRLRPGRYQIMVERRGSAAGISDYRAAVSVVRAY
ncbi:DUF5625 family protein [Pseudomonas eucalypticola]|uniref:DUF5625 domain-containing protein n=1 Tax=Pseudomonas eucalypticola TaxID=2599595 RepID=A0A7D5D922_9PSED|nr:DUF5625 family protein [Pseudomonas eucalypticola]QKZ05777.1 hypothetical protein HWQ56_19020 [Pseudomonas eucalypticola]